MSDSHRFHALEHVWRSTGRQCRSPSRPVDQFEPLFHIECTCKIIHERAKSIGDPAEELRGGCHFAPSSGKDSPMSTVTNNEQQTRVEARVRRIADFLRRQAHLAYVLAVWQGGRQTVLQALPDPGTALAVLRDAAGGPAADPKVRSSPTRRTPKQLRQLYAQVLACIHGLHNADVEFVMAVRIDGLAAQLCGKTRPSRRNLGAEVSAMLERAIRSRRACAGELVA